MIGLNCLNVGIYCSQNACFFCTNKREVGTQLERAMCANDRDPHIQNIKPIIFVSSLTLTKWLLTQKIKAWARNKGSGLHYWAHDRVCQHAFVTATISGTHSITFTCALLTNLCNTDDFSVVVANGHADQRVRLVTRFSVDLPIETRILENKWEWSRTKFSNCWYTTISTDLMKSLHS